MYKIILKKKKYIEGLRKEEILSLLELLEDNIEVLPIEIENSESECSVIGFISVEAASILDFNYKDSGLEDFIKVAMESGNDIFHFREISIIIVK